MVTALAIGNLCGEICAPTVRVGETNVDRVVPLLCPVSVQEASVSVAHKNPTSLIIDHLTDFHAWRGSMNRARMEDPTD